MSERNYDDIIGLPHHRSEKRPHMANSERAAQFSPFAALKGYDEEIGEAARYVSSRDEPDEAHTAEINDALVYLKNNIAQRPSVTVVYFEEDEKKAGGRKKTAAGRAAAVDAFRQTLTLEDGTVLPFSCILEIDL